MLRLTPSESRRELLQYTTQHMTGSEIKEPRRCPRCSAEPRLIGTMLDSNKGRTIRMFRCQCGEQSWVSDPA